MKEIYGKGYWAKAQNGPRESPGKDSGVLDCSSNLNQRSLVRCRDAHGGYGAKIPKPRRLMYGVQILEANGRRPTRAHGTWPTAHRVDLAGMFRVATPVAGRRTGGRGHARIHPGIAAEPCGLIRLDSVRGAVRLAERIPAQDVQRNSESKRIFKAPVPSRPSRILGATWG